MSDTWLKWSGALFHWNPVAVSFFLISLPSISYEIRQFWHVEVNVTLSGVFCKREWSCYSLNLQMPHAYSEALCNYSTPQIQWLFMKTIPMLVSISTLRILSNVVRSQLYYPLLQTLSNIETVWWPRQLNWTKVTKKNWHNSTKHISQ